MSKCHIVMIGPSLLSLGGISAVVNVYRRAGLFDRWNVNYISTYRDANALTKVTVALAGFNRYALLFLKGKVDLLHVHSASRWGFIRKSLFVLPALACGKPVIFQLHGGEFINVYENELGALARAYVRFILKRCAQIVVLTERWKVMLQRIAQDTTIRVIMNPIDSATASGSSTKRNPNILLFLGRLEERKGVYVLLDAIARLKDKQKFNLVIGGTGDLPTVESRIEELDIGDTVEILGWVDGERKDRLLDAATALVLPSFAEGLPMSMLEAMAHGTAVITTPVGGIPDLLEDGVDGILVDPGDRAQLSNAIELLLGNPAIARQMGAQGRKKFETRFSSDVIIPQVEALYADLGMRPKAADTVND